MLPCFRCCVCQHKPSSKDNEREMSEEKETFAKGMSFCSLLEMYEIYHRKKHISHFFASLSSCLYTLKPFLLDLHRCVLKERTKKHKEMRQSHTVCRFLQVTHKQIMGDLHFSLFFGVD